MTEPSRAGNEGAAVVESSRHRHESIGLGTIYSLTARVAFLISGYTIHIGLARALGPADYGIVGVILSLITSVRVLVADGPRPAISKITAEHEELASAIRGMALRTVGTFSLVVSMMLLGGAGVLAHLLRDQGLARYIRLAAPIVPIVAVFSVYLGSLNGLRAFGRQALATITYSIARVVLTLCGAWLLSLSGAVMGLVLAPLVALVAARFLLPPGRQGGTFPSSQLAHYSVPTILCVGAGTVLMSLDLFCVKALVGDGRLTGYYVSAATVAQIPYFALLPLADTLLPSTARLVAQGQRDNARGVIVTGLRYALMLLLPGVVLISATAPALMRFLYSEVYAGAGRPLAILIWGQAFYALFTVLASLLIAEGKPRQAMALALGMLPISLALNIALVPRHGLVGAASSTAFATFTGCVACSVCVRHDFGTVFQRRSVLATVGAALICGVCALVWQPTGMRLVAAYATLLLVYLAALCVLREVNADDLRRLRRLMRLEGASSL